MVGFPSDLVSSEMLSNISQQQLLSIIQDLMYASHGIASHGHETEIYAYRLMSFNPGMMVEGFKDRSFREEGMQAKQSLISILKIVESWGYKVIVEPHHEHLTPDDWAMRDDQYLHRVKVLVKPGDQYPSMPSE